MPNQYRTLDTVEGVGPTVLRLTSRAVAQLAVKRLISTQLELDLAAVATPLQFGIKFFI